MSTAIPKPGAGWLENKGKRPGNCKRARVVLETGDEPSYDQNPMSPPGWSADTTRWSRLGEPWDVAWYLPLDERA